MTSIFLIIYKLLYQCSPSHMYHVQEVKHGLQKCKRKKVEISTAEKNTVTGRFKFWVYRCGFYLVSFYL